MQADSWSYDPEIPFLSIYAREVKTRSWRDICIAIFTAALSQKSSYRNNQKYLSKEKMTYIHSYVWLLQAHGLYSPPGSFVQGISQVRLLGWVAISFSRGSSWPKGRTWVSGRQSPAGSLLHCRHIVHRLRHQGHLYKYNGLLFNYEKEGHSAACNMVGRGWH